MISSTGTKNTLNIRLLKHSVDCSVVALQGELDIAQRDRVIPFFTTLITSGQSSIVLDLSGLEFCDASGLGFLCRIRRLATAHGGWVRLAEPSPKIVKVLRVSRLSTGFTVFATVEQALLLETKG